MMLQEVKEAMPKKYPELSKTIRYMEEAGHRLATATSVTTLYYID